MNQVACVQSTGIPMQLNATLIFQFDTKKIFQCSINFILFVSLDCAMIQRAIFRYFPRYKKKFCFFVSIENKNKFKIADFPMSCWRFSGFRSTMRLFIDAQKSLITKVNWNKWNNARWVEGLFDEHLCSGFVASSKLKSHKNKIRSLKYKNYYEHFPITDNIIAI